MELHQHTSISEYSQPNHFLRDNHTGLRHRLPLTEANRNAQIHEVPSTGHFDKGFHSHLDKLMYATPIVPSHGPKHNLRDRLDLRRRNTRRNRQQHLSYSRNPVIDSKHYQAYRERQRRDDNKDEQKWPDILEVAFLDALLWMPAMGRRKYSYKGKPHGRNEMISEYLWLAYCQSLSPGVKPDETMRRARKQVSSHIQVLKTFLKEHPAYNRLFPPENKGKNAFDESFKHDPTLQAISEGRLPTKRYCNYGDSSNQTAQQQQGPFKPVIFWLLMTSSNEKCDDEAELYDKGMVSHRFTGRLLQRPSDSLETILNWRQRFPFLNDLHIADGPDCEVIHMDIGLSLLVTHPPEGSELCCRTDLSIPGRHPDHCEWKTFTTLHKPPELYRDDPPLEAEVTSCKVMSISDLETRIKVRFPAEPWAPALTCLRNLQAQHDENLRSQSLDSVPLITKPAKDYVDQISMYQEVQSSRPGQPLQRRCILLWTFHQCTSDENWTSTWRYLNTNFNPNPPISRASIMSPLPHHSHSLSAAMSENFNLWVDTPFHMSSISSHPSILDSFSVSQGLATPPLTAGLQSPFNRPSYGVANGYSNQTFNLHADNVGSSFASSETIDHDTTLVDVDGSAAAHLDHYLDNYGNSSNSLSANLDSYGHNWQLDSLSTDTFEADPSWTVYGITNHGISAGLGQWDSQDIRTTWNDSRDTTKSGWHSSHETKTNWGDVHDGHDSRGEIGPSDRWVDTEVNGNSNVHDDAQGDGDGSEDDSDAANKLNHSHDDLQHWTAESTLIVAGEGSPVKGLGLVEYGLEVENERVVQSIEQSLEEKLLPWIEAQGGGDMRAGAESQHTMVDESMTDASIVAVVDNVVEAQGWHNVGDIAERDRNELEAEETSGILAHDDFDYALLAERLK